MEHIRGCRGLEALHVGKWERCWKRLLSGIPLGTKIGAEGASVAYLGGLGPSATPHGAEARSSVVLC